MTRWLFAVVLVAAGSRGAEASGFATTSYDQALIVRFDDRVGWGGQTRIEWASGTAVWTFNDRPHVVEADDGRIAIINSYARAQSSIVVVVYDGRQTATPVALDDLDENWSLLRDAEDTPPGRRWFATATWQTEGLLVRTATGAALLIGGTGAVQWTTPADVWFPWRPSRLLAVSSESPPGQRFSDIGVGLAVCLALALVLGCRARRRRPWRRTRVADAVVQPIGSGRVFREAMKLVLGALFVAGLLALGAYVEDRMYVPKSYTETSPGGTAVAQSSPYPWPGVTHVRCPSCEEPERTLPRYFEEISVSDSGEIVGVNRLRREPDWHGYRLKPLLALEVFLVAIPCLGIFALLFLGYRARRRRPWQQGPRVELPSARLMS